MKSKIHRATVTRADLNYEGSCGIDSALLRAAGMVAGEQVHVVNVSNGSRAITYAIEAGPGEITLNGAMAQLGAVGDTVILICYANVEESELDGFRPAIVHVDSSNRIREQVAAG